MSLFTSLLTRVLDYTGPRALPTGTDYASGIERQTTAPSPSITRWHLADLEGAIHAADSGNMRLAGQLCRALRRDGTISGVLSTRTEGMVQLPVKFTGEDPDLVAELARDFRKVFPLSELALMLGDGILLGVGVGEFVQIDGHLPVLKRLDPQYLQYRWSEDRWYYQSIHGYLPVNPGDGRWVLHCPGGAVQPWSNGLWMSLGRSYIAKDHAFFYRENYNAKLANSARVGTSPAGAPDALRRSFFQRLAAWGVNTVFDLPPGWDIKLIESNGRGYEVFQQTIDTSEKEIIISLAGQMVTTTGGAGFQNSDIFKAIRSDLIQAGADGISDTLAYQGIPVWANERFGSEATTKALRATWDVTPPKDLTAAATANTQAAQGAEAMNRILATEGKRVNALEIARRYDVPVLDGAATPTNEEAPAQDVLD